MQRSKGRVPPAHSGPCNADRTSRPSSGRPYARSVLLALTFSVTLPWAASPGDASAGLAAYAAGDFDRAARELRPLAEQGLPEAAYCLARMYHHGQGLSADPAQAAQWYRRAAERGLAAAQNDLALLYERGSGVERDESEAARWYRRAADQGLGVAQYNLGLLYEKGRGVPRSAVDAATWYRRAAAQGHPGARERLAKSSEAADGARVSPAERGPAADPPAAVPAQAPALDSAHAPAGGDVAQGLAAFMRGDHATAYQVWSPLAEAGDAEAQYRLGTLCRQGLGTRRDPAAAETWYLKAAEQGHGAAMYDLAFLHLRGDLPGKGKDYVGAYMWFSLAAARNTGDAAQWRDRIAPRMSAREIEQAQEQVRTWPGHPPAP